MTAPGSGREGNENLGRENVIEQSYVVGAGRTSWKRRRHCTAGAAVQAPAPWSSPPGPYPGRAPPTRAHLRRNGRGGRKQRLPGDQRQASRGPCGRVAPLLL